MEQLAKNPYYKIRMNNTVQNIDSSDTISVRPFRLTEEMIRMDVRQQFGDSVRWKMDLLSEYDADYYGKRRSAIRFLFIG